MSTLPKYQPSGRFSAALWPWLFGSLVAGALLAGAYEAAMFYVPSVYVLFVIVLVFAVGTAVLTHYVIDRGKCRSLPAAFVLATLVPLNALLWSYAWNYRRFVSAVVAKDQRWTLLEAAKEALPFWLDARIKGGWQVGDKAMNGSFVVLMWVVEALIVLGLSLYLVWQELGRPFCEPCEVWTKSHVLSLRGVGRDEIASHLENGNLPALIALEPKADSVAAHRIVLSCAYCPQCSETGFLTVSQVTSTPQSNGQMQDKKVLLAEHLLLPRDQNRLFAARIAKRDAETV